MSGTLQNVVQATGDVKLFQLTNGLLKLMALPVIFFFYKLGESVTVYLYILIIISILGLFLQLYVVSKLIKKFSVLHYLCHVTLPQVCSYIIPFILALYLSYRHYNLFYSIIIFIVVIIVCFCSSWTIGLSETERKWLKAKVVEKFEGIRPFH